MLTIDEPRAMSRRGVITFHGALNDFLPVQFRQRSLTVHFSGNPSVKDFIEARGIPHPEVRLILADGCPVGFGYRLDSERHIEVFPPFHHPPFPEHQLLPVCPEGVPRFMLDVHLGNLARLLRMLGFDCIYDREDIGDARIADRAQKENRILLTRDIGLLKRSAVIYGHWVRDKNAKQQLRDVVHHYRLSREISRPFTRCLYCNAYLVIADKNLIAHRVPARVISTFDDFRACEYCDRVYWQGTHYRNMKKLVDTLWPASEEEDRPAMAPDLYCHAVARPEKVGLQ